MHAHTHTHIYVCVRARAHGGMHACMRVCMVHACVFDTGTQKWDKEIKNSNSAIQTDVSFITFLNTFLKTGNCKKIITQC